MPRSLFASRSSADPAGALALAAPPSIDATRWAAGLAVAVAMAIGASALLGCTPAVGDRCALSTDCSIQGTRICDTSQPNGYCTLLGCTASSCPDNAACVEFGASVPGCPYDDYGAPSRTGRAMCLKTCGSNSDCRQSEGYVCIGIDPKLTPWTVILDTNQSERVCMFSGPSASFVDAQVCSSSRPDAAPIDATMAGEATSEAGPETGDGSGDVGQETADSQGAMDSSEEATDAGQENGDRGDTAGATADATADGIGDEQADGTLNAIVDSDMADAPDGG
jgi:hypothetical protein